MITKTLAEIYLKQGDLRKAYEIYKALSEQDPSNEETRTRLAELGEKLGLSPPTPPKLDQLTEEKIRRLRKVLNNIQQRRRG